MGKMHILFVSSWWPSNRSTSGVFVKEQAEAICKLGQKVTVLYVQVSLMRPWLKRLVRGPRERYLESEMLQVVRERLVYPWPARFSENPIRQVKQYFVDRVLSKLERHFDVHGRPDIVHHHCMSDNAYLTEAIAQRYRIPYVFTEYSNYWRYSNLRKFNWFETSTDDERFVRNAAERIAAAEVRAEGYEAIFGAPFIRIPNLVVDEFAAPIVKRPPGQPFTFICVAVLDRRKRQDLVLKAFAHSFKGQNARLILVGNGVLEQEYKELANRLGLNDRVEFKGIRGRTEVRDLFDAANVCVLASDQETFAIVLAEAMFRGLPVISTRSGGPEEFVTAENGYLIPTGDEHALAERMVEIRDSYNRFNPETIRRGAMSQFSERAVARQIVGVYERVCSKSASAA
jgi:L-malate glycosyltransferase